MEETAIPGVRFSVLGPLRAHRDGVELDLGSPQQRAVTAVLVLRHGRAVSVDDLVAALWESPPARPEAVVRTYVWRLRHLLEPGHAPREPWRLLPSVPGGYTLRLGEGAVDREDFEQRVAEARARKAAGQTPAARRLFDQALAAWRETALMGVPGPFAEAERGRLEERRLDVVEARLETMVELGACAEAATELSVLAEAHPLREGLHYLLMEALHQTGRQGEALAAYRRVHRLLAEELGIEPNARLQQLHADILQRTAPSVGRTQVVSARQDRAPRQLPNAVPDFTGRAEETAGIRGVLADPPTGAVPVVLVTGMGGTGKTSLVMHSVQPLLDAYPDGQLYADLRGADGSPADPGTVLAAFLRALGEGDAYIPDDLSERAALYRSRLAQRRVLIVLDNAADMHQVLPLLPGAATCAVVVTSRNGLATLPVSLRVILGALPEEEALALLTRLVTAARVEAEPDTARRILTACGGLPLAVRIVGSRLAARPEWSLADLAERLADERHRLAELTVDTVTVASSFALGYGQLDPAARQTLRLLALPAHGVHDLRTAGAVLDIPGRTARPLLERLVSAGLLESPALDRYRYHDLVRLFARRLATEADPPELRDAALGRLLDLHLVAAAESYRVIRPGHTVARAALPQTRDAVRFGGVEEALAWSAAAFDDIVLLLGQTAASHTDRAATLLLLLDAVATTAHLWHQLIPVAARVADAAARAGDARSEGRARYILAGALVQVGRMEEAEEHVARAVAASRGDDDVHALALNVQGGVVGHRDHGAALSSFENAAGLARRLGNRSLEAMALGNAVQARLRADGIDARTVADAERQVALYRQLGDRYGEADALYRHGQVLVRLGKLDEAVADYHRALDLLADGQHEFMRAGCLCRLSEASTQAGRPQQALQYAEESVALARAIRHEHLEALSLRALGDALAAADRPEQARRHWREALVILRNFGHRATLASVEKRLAQDA